MKFTAVLAASALLLAHTPAVAQSSAGRTIAVKEPGSAGASGTHQANATCDALSAQIDKEQRLMALDAALGENDDSAPREQVRATKRVGRLLQIQIAMGQLTALKCAPFTDPIVDGRFATAASQCRMALQSTTTPKGYGLPLACRIAEWSPE